MLLLQSIFTLPAISILWQASDRGSTPIGVILILVFLVILLYWWGINRSAYDQIGQPDAQQHAHDSHVDNSHDRHQTIDIQPPTEPVHKPEAASDAVTEPDNLKLIEGIGPKIEQILNAANIQTFAQLAATEVSQLEKIVREDAGIRIAFPDTWPQQAQLAAAGEWEAFTKLQEELQGGREK